MSWLAGVNVIGLLSAAPPVEQAERENPRDGEAVDELERDDRW